MPLEWFVNVVVDPRMGAVAVLAVWLWKTLKDVDYEREQRKLERDAYEARLIKREEQFIQMSERGHQNASATTAAINAIRDMISAGGRRNE